MIPRTDRNGIGDSALLDIKKPILEFNSFVFFFFCDFHVSLRRWRSSYPAFFNAFC